jgi:hypothetical protein
VQNSERPVIVKYNYIEGPELYRNRFIFYFRRMTVTLAGRFYNGGFRAWLSLLLLTRAETSRLLKFIG